VYSTILSATSASDCIRDVVNLVLLLVVTNPMTSRWCSF